VVVDAHSFPGAPLVEEVDLEVDHVHVAQDGTCKVITGIGLHRRWTLRRIDGGPWRIGIAEAI
jgi:hypothetical protein